MYLHNKGDNTLYLSNNPFMMLQNIENTHIHITNIWLWGGTTI